MKRLCIFQLYDREGVVDEYIFYWINEIIKEGFKIYVVSNGCLNKKSRLRLEATCEEVFFREDYGFDVMAFRYALIEKLGRDVVDKYDECIIINDTVFGPFCPLKRIIQEMYKRKCDFWGITQQYPINDYLELGNNIPYHIQAYFVFFTRQVLRADVFWQYWENLRSVENYRAAIQKYEFNISQTLIEAGFISDAFYNDRHFEDQKFVDLMERPIILIESGVPVLKKKIVTDKHYLDLDYFALRNYLYNILLYINQHYDYDINLIIGSIERIIKVKIDLETLYKYKNKGLMTFRRDQCWNYKIISENVYKFIVNHNCIWLYGAGCFAYRIIRIIHEISNIDIAGILVSDTRDNPLEVLGIQVYLADTVLQNQYKEDMSVLITIKDGSVSRDIEKYLRGNGIISIERIEV